MASINASTSGGGGIITTADATGNLDIQSAGSTVVAVTATGASVTGTLAATGAVTLTGSLNTPNTFGFKNRIINGGMNTDQRNAAASQTFTAAAALAYSVDRWYGYCTGANVTGQQIAGGTTPTVTQNRYRFTGAASVTAVGFGQRIEQKNSYDLAGSTCTLSADLGISATLTTVTWTAYYATTTADTFGSLASPTVTSIATGTFTVGATVANFSANISIPAAATTGIQILFTVGALTAGLTWTIGNVQLEKGSTATSFDFRDYGRELMMCQRYYVKAVKSAAEDRPWTLEGATSGAIWYPTANLYSPVSMRSTPTVTLLGTISYTNCSFENISSQLNGVRFQVAASTSGGRIYALPNNTGAGYSLDSEL
tara:strand:- start:157 stop:1266 length:1110 start_codon:yes stop_codon:yes gene_type:complete